MSSLSRNSCAKAFGNWSRGKNIFDQKIRGGGGSTNTPPASLRVKILTSLSLAAVRVSMNFSWVVLRIFMVFPRIVFRFLMGFLWRYSDIFIILLREIGFLGFSRGTTV